jgi:pyruvate carboxylase
MSGQTSQPNMNSMVAALDHTKRATGLDLDALNLYADYWDTVRDYYPPYPLSGRWMSTYMKCRAASTPI